MPILSQAKALENEDQYSVEISPIMQDGEKLYMVILKIGKEVLYKSVYKVGGLFGHYEVRLLARAFINASLLKGANLPFSVRDSNNIDGEPASIFVETEFCTCVLYQHPTRDLIVLYFACTAQGFENNSHFGVQYDVRFPITASEAVKFGQLLFEQCQDD